MFTVSVIEAFGRTNATEIVHPETQETLVAVNQFIDAATMDAMIDAGVDTVVCVGDLRPYYRPLLSDGSEWPFPD